MSYRWAFAAIIVVIIVLIAVACYKKYKPKRYKFMPIPELICDKAPIPKYSIDMTGRGAAGTVAWEPLYGASDSNPGDPRRDAFLTLRRRPDSSGVGKKHALTRDSHHNTRIVHDLTMRA